MLDLSVLLLAGQAVIALYATVITVLTTACLTLHVLTMVDKLVGRRAHRAAEQAGGMPVRRSLFVRLSPEPAGDL